MAGGGDGLAPSRGGRAEQGRGSCSAAGDGEGNVDVVAWRQEDSKTRSIFQVQVGPNMSPKIVTAGEFVKVPRGVVWMLVPLWDANGREMC